MEFLQVSGTVWEKAFQNFANFSPIIPLLVYVLSLLVLPVPTLNSYIQKENISLVKMKMLKYPRKQSWKKVKENVALYYTHTHTYNYSSGITCLHLMSDMVQVLLV